jgi:hypothetical protein
MSVRPEITPPWHAIALATAAKQEINEGQTRKEISNYEKLDKQS